MKKYYSMKGGVILGALFCFLLLGSSILLAQEKEISITTSSQEALKYFLEGRDLQENLAYASATKLLDKAIELDPDFAMAYLYRAYSGGGFNVFRENLEKAADLVDKVSDGEKHWILARKAYSDSDTPTMKEHADHLMKLYPADKRVQTLMGNYYYTLHNDFPKALQCYQKAVELDKDYASVYNMIGYCQLVMENYEEAEKAFKRYIEIIPDAPNPYDSYAEFLMDRGRYDESIENYEKAYEKDPLYTVALRGIGHNYIFKGNFNKAREYYQKWFEATDAVNEKLGAYFWEAVSYAHEGEIEKTVEAMDQYSSLAEKENLATSNIYSCRVKGYALTEMGEEAKGFKEFEKAVRMVEEADLPQAVKETQKVYTAIDRVYALASNDKLEEAEKEAAVCKEMVLKRKNPDEERFLFDTIGMVELEKGKADEAIAYFSKGNKESPWNWFLMGKAYTKKGDETKAAEYFKKIVECNVNSMPLALTKERAKEILKK
jgi:tetratricopeptide (TPR) repeat protein